VKKVEEMRRLLWCLREEGRGRLYGCGFAAWEHALEEN